VCQYTCRGGASRKLRDGSGLMVASTLCLVSSRRFGHLDEGQETSTRRLRCAVMFQGHGRTTVGPLALCQLDTRGPLHESQYLQVGRKHHLDKSRKLGSDVLVVRSARRSTWELCRLRTSLPPVLRLDSRTPFRIRICIGERNVVIRLMLGKTRQARDRHHCQVPRRRRSHAAGDMV
jgi:hypothetical protein